MATMRRALIAAVLALCLASDAGASRVVDGSGSDATRADPSVGSLGGDDRNPASESSSEAAALGAYVGTQGFVDKPPEPKGLPRAVFIHIPKTGGTTIELSAARRGVRLGMCAARCESVNNRCETFDPEQLYETQPGYGKCSRVHRPPRFSNGVVPDSFCVVRNPFDRLISEFHYNRAMPWNAKSKFEDTCEDFQTWLTQVTDVVINSKMVQCHLRAIEPGSTIDPDRDCPVAAPKGTPWEDCHTLPQSLYVAGCETVLANERWEEDVMPFMHKVAGVEPSEMEKATLYKYKFNGGEHARDGGRGALGGGRAAREAGRSLPRRGRQVLGAAQVGDDPARARGVRGGLQAVRVQRHAAVFRGAKPGVHQGAPRPEEGGAARVQLGRGGKQGGRD